MTYRPLIAVTMGDAAGIGAEIIMKSLGHTGIHACCRPLVIGDAARLRAAGRIIASALAVRVLPHTEIETTKFENDVVNCIDLGLIPPICRGADCRRSPERPRSGMSKPRRNSPWPAASTPFARRR